MIVFLRQDFYTWMVLSTILFISVFYVALINVLRRWRLSQELPGMPIPLLDIWGDVKHFRIKPPPRFSKCVNIYTLQTLSGYAQLFRSKMIFCFWMTFIPIVWVVKAEAVEELISGNKNLQKSWFYDWLRPWVNTGLGTSHGKKWKSRRKLLTPAFHFDILIDFLPTMNDKSQILVEILAKETQKDWTDIGALISLCTLDVICETTLGVRFNTQENNKSEFVEAIARVSSIIMQRMANPLYLFDCFFYMSEAGRKFNKDVKLIHAFTRLIIRQKKSMLLQGRKSSVPKNRKALMDVLLEHQLQNLDLTEEDIREEVDTFTFGGHDTISMAVTWALYLIGLHQDVQDRITEELEVIFGGDDERPITADDLRSMEYLARVLKESQRLYPSVPMFSRRSDSENIINGYKIPEGTAVTVLTYELHRDPEVFPDPERFDPDRFLPENSAKRHPYSYIPFSAGPRNCIGQRFAVMEAKVIIASILRNYYIESLDPRDKVIPVAGITLKSAEPLKIRIRYKTL